MSKLLKEHHLQDLESWVNVDNHYVTPKIVDFGGEKCRGSRITTYTYFTRLRQALKLKFAPLFAPLTNLLKQT